MINNLYITSVIISLQDNTATTQNKSSEIPQVK